MTTNVDICNRALNAIGIKKKISSLSQDSIEAQSCLLVFGNLRDDLLRMAPWDCALNTANLVYITSAPGTPENTSPATTLWEKGQPAPPWAYEYQYPIDCLRACWIIPSLQTGFSGVPITTAITGGVPTTWNGPPVRFKVQVDQFFPVTAAAKVAGGANYAIGDVITLPYGPTTEPPIGAPVQLIVTTLAGSAVATVTVVGQVLGESPPLGGSYFAKQTGTIAQDTTDGAGTGATFTLTFGAQASQRVILTDQEFATLTYVKQITDPNLMDTLFQSAWTNLLASAVCMALTGDKALANSKIALANQSIIDARKADANEGLTVNDITPDWMRIRGINFADGCSGPYSGFDWGGLWPIY